MIDPSRWTHGLQAAVERLAEHVVEGKPPPRFDARDREALAFLLFTLYEKSNGSLRKVSQRTT